MDAETVHFTGAGVTDGRRPALMGHHQEQPNPPPEPAHMVQGRAGALADDQQAPHFLLLPDAKIRRRFKLPAELGYPEPTLTGVRRVHRDIRSGILLLHADVSCRSHETRGDKTGHHGFNQAINIARLGRVPFSRLSNHGTRT